jgi:hypothetical protein
MAKTKAANRAAHADPSRPDHIPRAKHTPSLSLPRKGGGNPQTTNGATCMNPLVQNGGRVRKGVHF